MEIRDSVPTTEADFTAALPLDISEETASRSDDLLREFAEEAGLDTALIVDRSGALVAGISAEAEVTVEVISALVAGASGAMRALVAQLGESGAMESLHLGGNRLIYLKETVHRFILVAVAESARPAGIVRQQALAIEGRLADLLRDVRPAEPPIPSGPTPPMVKSLRETVRERAARRQGVPDPDLFPGIPSEAVTGPVFEFDSGEDEEVEDEQETEPTDASEFVSGFGEPVALPCDEEPRIEESFETLDLQSEERDPSGDADAVVTPEDLAGGEPGSEPSPVAELTLSGLRETIPPTPIPDEPREILEPIDFGEPEIVIENTNPETIGSDPLPRLRIPVDSPFETEEEEEEDEEETGAGWLDSAFEFDAEDDGEVGLLTTLTPPEAQDPVAVGDSGDETLPPPLPTSFPVSPFEDDDEDDDDGEGESAGASSLARERPQFEGGEELDRFEEEDEIETEERVDEVEEEALKSVVFTNGVAETILFEMPREPATGEAGKHPPTPPGPGNPVDAQTGREPGGLPDEEEEEESELRGSGPFYF